MCSLHSKLSLQFHFKGLSVFPLEFVLAVVATVTEGGFGGQARIIKGFIWCSCWRGVVIGVVSPLAQLNSIQNCRRRDKFAVSQQNVLQFYVSLFALAVLCSHIITKAKGTPIWAPGYVPGQ